MACGSLTPAVSVATAGLLQGTGIGIPAALPAAISAFTSGDVVGAAQAALGGAAAVVGNPLAGLGANILPAITGVVPTNLTGVLSSGNLNNFAGQIMHQANQIMSGGIGGFAQIFAQAQGFAMNSLNINSFAQYANGLTFPQLGLGITNFSGVLTNGLASMGNLPNLGYIMRNTGSLFNLTDMRNMASPGYLMQNLLDKGLNSTVNLTGMLEYSGVPLDQITSVNYQDQITDILTQIQGDDLKNICNTLNADLPDSVTNLADVLDLEKLTTPEILDTLNVTSLNEIGTQFSDMGASFLDGDEINNLISNIETADFPRLNDFYGNSLVPDSVKNILGSDLGVGSGSFGNPLIQDMIGSVGGITHTECLNSMIDPLNTIKNSPDGALLNTQFNLMADVANGVYGGSGNAIIDGTNLVSTNVTIPPSVLSAAGMSGIPAGDITATLIAMRLVTETVMSRVAQTNTGTLGDAVNTISAQYNKTATQLYNEKANLAQAGIDVYQFSYSRLQPNVSISSLPAINQGTTEDPYSAADFGFVEYSWDLYPDTGSVYYYEVLVDLGLTDATMGNVLIKGYDSVSNPSVYRPLDPMLGEFTDDRSMDSAQFKWTRTLQKALVFRFRTAKQIGRSISFDYSCDSGPLPLTSWAIVRDPREFDKVKKTIGGGSSMSEALPTYILANGIADNTPVVKAGPNIFTLQTDQVYYLVIIDTDALAPSGIKERLNVTVGLVLEDFKNYVLELPVKQNDTVNPITGKTLAPGAIANALNVPYDPDYPKSPLTDWTSDDLYRYWVSLPVVNTVSTTSNVDICKGSMYISSQLFTNGADFVTKANNYLDAQHISHPAKPNAAVWNRSIYPDVLQVSFDVTTGICYFANDQWRAEGLLDNRPFGYPRTGIPTQLFGAPGAVVSGDKNSIVGFASQLHEIGQDTNNLGLASLVESMATDNVYGDAIKAAMVEGRNMQRLRGAGIRPVGACITIPDDFTSVSDNTGTNNGASSTSTIPRILSVQIRKDTVRNVHVATIKYEGIGNYSNIKIRGIWSANPTEALAGIGTTLIDKQLITSPAGTITVDFSAEYSQFIDQPLMGFGLIDGSTFNWVYPTTVPPLMSVKINDAGNTVTPPTPPSGPVYTGPGAIPVTEIGTASGVTRYADLGDLDRLDSQWPSMPPYGTYIKFDSVSKVYERSAGYFQLLADRVTDQTSFSIKFVMKPRTHARISTTSGSDAHILSISRNPGNFTDPIFLRNNTGNSAMIEFASNYCEAMKNNVDVYLVSGHTYYLNMRMPAQRTGHTDIIPYNLDLYAQPGSTEDNTNLPNSIPCTHEQINVGNNGYIVNSPPPDTTPPKVITTSIPGYSKTWNIPLTIPAVGTMIGPTIVSPIARTDAMVASFVTPSVDCVFNIKLTTYDAANIIHCAVSTDHWDFTSSKVITSGNKVNFSMTFSTTAGYYTLLKKGTLYYINMYYNKKTPPANADLYIDVTRS